MSSAGKATPALVRREKTGETGTRHRSSRKPQAHGAGRKERRQERLGPATAARGNRKHTGRGGKRDGSSHLVQGAEVRVGDGHVLARTAREDEKGAEIESTAENTIHCSFGFGGSVGGGLKPRAMSLDTSTLRNDEWTNQMLSLIHI